MAKFFPDSEAKIPWGDGLAVGYEKGFSCGSGRVEEISDGKDMRVCYVTDVCVVLKILIFAEDEGSFAVTYAAVYCRYGYTR